MGWQDRRTSEPPSGGGGINPAVWARAGNTDDIPAGKLDNAPGAGKTPATWAESGNTDDIPSSKLHVARNRVETWAQVDVINPIPAEKLINAPTGIEPETWAAADNTDPIPANKLTNAPAGTGTGTGTAPATWAEAGNTDDIPSSKLHVARNRVETWAQVDVINPIPAEKLINAPTGTEPETWAAADNTDPIPANKLTNAPAGTGTGTAPATWAADGNEDAIPANKLINAPGPSPHAADPLPENLQRLGEVTHFTTHDEAPSLKLKVPNLLETTLAPIFAYLQNEHTSEVLVNEFGDLAPAAVLPGALELNTRYDYSEGHRQYRRLPRDHQLIGATLTVNNIPTTHGVIFGTDFELTNARLLNDDGFDVLKFGNAEPVLRINRYSGLHLRIGSGDSGERVRTYTEPILTNNSQFGFYAHAPLNDSVAGQAIWAIPHNTAGLTLEVDFVEETSDQGIETLDITQALIDAPISDRNGETSFSHDFIWGSFTFTLNFIYSERTRELSASWLVENAGLHWTGTLYQRVTERWNVPTGFSDVQVNPGDGNDENGLFNPTYWQTEREVGNNIQMILLPYRAGDTSADPEMAAVVVVDGEAVAHRQRLRRTASEIGFTGNTHSMSFGDGDLSFAWMNYYTFNPTQHRPTFGQLLSIDETARFYGLVVPNQTHFAEIDFAVDQFSVDSLAVARWGNNLADNPFALASGHPYPIPGIDKARQIYLRAKETETSNARDSVHLTIDTTTEAGGYTLGNLNSYLIISDTGIEIGGNGIWIEQLYLIF